MLANPAKMQLINTDLHAASRYRYGTNMSPHCHGISFKKSQHHIIDPTNPRRAVDDRVEDRLHVRGRAADDTEPRGGRGLMLQGSAHLCVALAELIEEPDIFDSD